MVRLEWFCKLKAKAQVAVALTREDVIRAHARDELGIDVDNYTSPVQASGV